MSVRANLKVGNLPNPKLAFTNRYVTTSFVLIPIHMDLMSYFSNLRAYLSKARFEELARRNSLTVGEGDVVVNVSIDNNFVFMAA